MSYIDKLRKKAQEEKMVERALASQKYKEAKRRDNLITFALLCLVTCDYLELKHRYGKNGFLDWLRFAGKRMKYIADDDEGYCLEMNEYIKDRHNLDVLALLGVKLGKDGVVNGKG